MGSGERADAEKSENKTGGSGKESRRPLLPAVCASFLACESILLFSARSLCYFSIPTIKLLASAPHHSQVLSCLLQLSLWSFLSFSLKMHAMNAVGSRARFKAE